MDHLQIQFGPHFFNNMQLDANNLIGVKIKMRAGAYPTVKVSIPPGTDQYFSSLAQ